MVQTKLMQADEIAYAFNGSADRQYWRAALGGSRLNPEVHFNSRSSMVRITYRISTGDFAVSFSKTDAAFGDFMSSVSKAMEQIMGALVSAGLPFTMPASDQLSLRVEYAPKSKLATCYLANLGDPWPEAEPVPFKEPVRENAESTFSGIDL